MLRGLLRKPYFRSSLYHLNRHITSNFSTTPAQGYKLKGFRDVTVTEYAEIWNESISMCTWKKVAETFQRGLPILTERHVVMIFDQMAKYEVPLDQDFNNMVLPMTKDFIRAFDKENSVGFSRIAHSLALLGVEDQELWNIVKDQIVERRMYRYIQPQEFGKLIYALARTGQADQETFRLLGEQVLKHKINLPEECVSLALSGFRESGLDYKDFEKSLGLDENQRERISLQA